MTIHKHTDRGIRGEHCHLRELLERVLETLAARHTDRNTVIGMLEEVASEVLEHFEHEEAGGYFAEAIEIAPRLSDRADELLSQHPHLAEQLAVMRRHAETRGPYKHWRHELHRQFLEFVDCFRAHESAENELLMDVYNNDIGAED